MVLKYNKREDFKATSFFFFQKKYSMHKHSRVNHIESYGPLIELDLYTLSFLAV
jgi:hypothetical protein